VFVMIRLNMGLSVHNCDSPFFTNLGFKDFKHDELYNFGTFHLREVEVKVERGEVSDAMVHYYYDGETLVVALK
jgi:hypothetical protein